MRTIIVIPARYASTRLPGKPLLRTTGKYLIEHVYEQASRCKRADEVLVATDDPRIVAACKRFGAPVVMTRRDHPSGTDRIAEVARLRPCDVVVNVQGDEPQVDPKSLDTLIDLMRSDPSAKMATLAVPLRDEAAYRNPNCVKVVCDGAGRAIYFSRSPIPFVREGKPNFRASPPQFLQHLGLYAYRRDALLELAATPPARTEEAEKLEQLRALDLGWTIRVGITEQVGHGVDTVEDYHRFVTSYRGTGLRIAA